MARGMTLDQAKEECARWLAYIERQKTKATEMAKIATAVRNGEIDQDESRRRVRALDNCSVTVFDGAKLEQALRVLLKHVG